MSESGPLIFFDGECGLCHRFVRFLLARDKRKRFRFAPLRGRIAKEKLGTLGGKAAETVVLFQAGRVHVRSGAALRSLAALGGGWKIALAGLWIPRFARDAAYDFVARRRRRWFGGGETCALPSPDRDPRILG